MILCNRFRLVVSTLRRTAFVYIIMAIFGGVSWASIVDITYSPSPVNRNIGEQWSLDIIFNGEILRPLFSLHHEFKYDQNVISRVSADFNPSWLNVWNYTTSTTISTGSSGGLETVEFSIDSGYLEEPKTLSNQIIGTVVFDAVGLGTSDFDLIGYGYGSVVVPSDQDLRFNEPAVGQITVSGENPIPEPATMLLLGSGLLGLAGFRRRFKKR